MPKVITFLIGGIFALIALVFFIAAAIGYNPYLNLLYVLGFLSSFSIAFICAMHITGDLNENE